jgi:hypothetical protein
MSRVVQEFALTAQEAGAAGYTARVRGEADASGVWHGWIEFVPQDGGPALRTGRETTQSSLEQLQYWASGLSTPYLEMALERARRADSRRPDPGGSGIAPADGPMRTRGFDPEAVVARLELETLDPTLPQRVMAARDLFEGRVRRIAGGGILVYDGMSAPEGEPTRHAFLLQYGSTNAAAVLANHLWSELHGQGASLFLEGVFVEIDSHQMTERLKALLHATSP